MSGRRLSGSEIRAMLLSEGQATDNTLEDAKNQEAARQAARKEVVAELANAVGKRNVESPTVNKFADQVTKAKDGDAKTKSANQRMADNKSGMQARGTFRMVRDWDPSDPSHLHKR